MPTPAPHDPEHGRRRVQGTGRLGMVTAVAVSAGLLYAFEWPVLWWTDPAALTRLALAFIVVALAWLRFDRR